MRTPSISGGVASTDKFADVLRQHKFCPSRCNPTVQLSAEPGGLAQWLH